MVADLQTDTNQNYRLFEKFHTESKAVVLSVVSVIVAALALMMAWLAVYDSVQARAEVRMQNQQLEAMRDKIAAQDAKLYLMHQELNNGR